MCANVGDFGEQMLGLLISGLLWRRRRPLVVPEHFFDSPYLIRLGGEEPFLPFAEIGWVYIGTSRERCLGTLPSLRGPVLDVASNSFVSPPSEEKSKRLSSLASAAESSRFGASASPCGRTAPCF
jgi:hypothetical protein